MINLIKLLLRNNNNLNNNKKEERIRIDHLINKIKIIMKWKV